MFYISKFLIIAITTRRNMIRCVFLFSLLSICVVMSLQPDDNPNQYLTDRKLNDDKLGRKLNIIGGKTTTIEKHPYEVSVSLSYGFVAGAILNKYWILTSALTLYTNSSNSLEARVGSNNSDAGGTLYSIEKTIIHPNFSADTFQYDLALHKLSKPLKFSKTVKSITLPSKELKSGQKAIVSGWGETTTSNGNPFKQIKLTTVDRDDCAKSYAIYDYPIGASQICASAKDYKNGPYFDFGAPFVAQKKLYALYSFRIIQIDTPIVFSNVYIALEWIRNTIKK